MDWFPLAAATGQPILLLVIGLASVVLKFRAAIARGVAGFLLPHPRPGYGSLSPAREEENPDGDAMAPWSRFFEAS